MPLYPADHAGAIAIAPKDPDSTIDYQFNWSAWLGTDTISASTWIVPASLTSEAESKTDTLTTIWLSGGTAGSTYEVTNRIVTVGGRTEDRTMSIAVEDK